MWPLLLLLTARGFAQVLDLSSIQALEEKLPDYDSMNAQETKVRRRVDNKYRPPSMVTKLESIEASPHEMGSLPGGVPLVRLSDNKVFRLQRPMYVRYHALQDESGFKYLVNKDSSVTFRVDSKYVEPIKEELSLYEPPVKYTPAPLNLSRTEYDQQLGIRPEASFYLGHVMGDFMEDLFNDPKARNGVTTQYGAHLFTKWKLPLKVGAVVHYEKSIYTLTGGHTVNYHSLSFGPQIKSKDLEFHDFLYRLQLQLRVSPFAHLNAETDLGTADFKFNSTDLLASIEHPVSNFLGEFVIGLFYQAQWLNFRDQPEIVSVRASNKLNSSLGLSLSQVFD